MCRAGNAWDNGQGIGRGVGQGAGQGSGQGDGRGIGMAITQDFARGFVAEGARVVADRQGAAPAATAMTGGIGQNRDVTDPASSDATAAAVFASTGSIDVLVSEQKCSSTCSPPLGAAR